MAISSSREASASASARCTSCFSARTCASSSSCSMARVNRARFPLFTKSSAPWSRTSIAACSPTLPETTMNGVPARSEAWTISSACRAENRGMLKSERMTSQGLRSASRSPSALSTRFHSTDQPYRRRWRSTRSTSSSTSSTCSTRSGLMLAPTKSSSARSARSRMSPRVRSGARGRPSRPGRAGGQGRVRCPPGALEAPAPERVSEPSPAPPWHVWGRSCRYRCSQLRSVARSWSVLTGLAR